MAAHFVDIKLVITKKPKASYYDLSRDADNNMEHQIDSATKDNGLLAKRTIKNKIRQLLSKYKHENDFHEHGKQRK